ncbi:MAG TPA: hypothetical protein VGI81_00530 [Tepidisphaeraceae bacterium]
MSRYARNLCPLLLLLGVMTVVQSGCVQTSTTPQRHGSGFQSGDLPEMTGKGSGAGTSAQGQPVSPDELTSKDRCPARLQDIAGALLLYYHFHGEVPPNLEALREYNGNLILVCPDTNQPYAYSPNGLRKPGATKRILVYDAIRNSDGTRWCLLATEARPGKPIETDVVQLPEPLFLAYQ